MKHGVKATFVLVLIFLLAQFIGLVVLNQYINTEKTEIAGEIVWEELPNIGTVGIERPDVEPAFSVWYLFTAILIGTLLVLLIIKFGKMFLWRLWFFFAAWITLHIAFGAFIPANTALALALIFAWIKAYKPSFMVHNFTELFIYAGLAAIFVPIISFRAMVILLLLISVYDMYAVWKSKHMIKMAKFQTKAGIFSGLLIPYVADKHRLVKKKLKVAIKRGKKQSNVRVAVLGGGDIGFPLLFAGVVMKTYGFAKASIIPPFVALALFGLLYYGNKNKFYPAMPYLTVGCFVGYGVMLLF